MKAVGHSKAFLRSEMLQSERQLNLWFKMVLVSHLTDINNLNICFKEIGILRQKYSIYILCTRLFTVLMSIVLAKPEYR